MISRDDDRLTGRIRWIQGETNQIGAEADSALTHLEHLMALKALKVFRDDLEVIRASLADINSRRVSAHNAATAMMEALESDLEEV